MYEPNESDDFGDAGVPPGERITVEHAVERMLVSMVSVMAHCDTVCEPHQSAERTEQLSRIAIATTKATMSRIIRNAGDNCDSPELLLLCVERDVHRWCADTMTSALENHARADNG